MSTWFFIRCLVLAAYGYEIFKFCHSLLGSKMAPKITALLIILYEILFDYIILSRLLKVSYYFAIVISQIGLIMLILLLFYGNISKKLAFSTVIYVIQELTAYSVMPILARFGDLISNYIFKADLPMIVIYIIWVVQYIINCIIIHKIPHSCSNLSESIPSKVTLMLLIPSISIMLALEFASYACNERQIFLSLLYQEGSSHPLVYQLADPVILFFLSILGLAANLVIVFWTNNAMQQLLTEQHLSMQIVNYKKLEKQDQEIRKVRHDLKNHIISLQGLLSDGNIEAAKDYLNLIAKKSFLTEPFIKTGNSIADAIINVKYEEAKQFGIDFNCDVKLPDIKISDFDLCIILGNALDNAIESCNCISTINKKKFISLQSCIVKSYLIIEIKNSMINQNLEPISFTTKKSKSQWHGIGIKSIHAAIEKYQGTIDITIKPDIFCLSIMLPK